MRILRFCGMAALTLAAGVAVAADGSDAKAAEPAVLSAAARAEIGAAAENPDTLTKVMNGLSAAEQKSFLAAVNAAIAKAPGSTEQRAAMFLKANRAAIKCGVAKKNMADLLGVTFATVPTEYLPVVSETFAVELFNRAADANKTFTDAAFEKIATETVKRIETETASTDDAPVRDTLAILMFVRASNGTPADLADKLVDTIPDKDARETARKEWIPAALAEGDKKSYDGMLAFAGAGKAPDARAVMVFTGPQTLDALLSDVATSLLSSDGKLQTPILDQTFGGFGETRLNTVDDSAGVADKSSVSTARPLTQDPTKPWNPNYTRGNASEKAAEAKAMEEALKPEPEPEPEPKPYPYGDLGN